MSQNSTVEWPSKDGVVIFDTSDGDGVKEREDLADIDDSNIEVREVYFGDYPRQNAYTEEDVDTIVEVPDSEPVTGESFCVPFDADLLNDNDTTSETTISPIVESSDVSLR